MKKYFLLPVTFISFSIPAISQSALVKDKEISVVAGMSATMIRNSNIEKDKNITADDKNGVDFSIEFSKYFMDRIGVGVGLGYSSFDQVYYQKGLFKQTNQVDNAGRVYDKWINSDIRYSNKLMYANVPVTAHLIIGNSSICYGFVDAGIINQFLISGTYKKTGMLETIAKYPSETGNPDWFGITMNNSDYNAKSNVVSEKDTKKYAPYTLSGHLAVGIAVAITKRMFLKVQPYMNVGLTDIVGKDAKGKAYENVYGETSSYKPTKLYSAGLNAGLSFDL